MLVVSRKIGERIFIGDKIAVTVVKIGNGGVRIGIEAPPEMAIVREELAKQLRLAEQQTIDSAAEQDAPEAVTQPAVSQPTTNATQPTNTKS